MMDVLRFDAEKQPEPGPRLPPPVTLELAPGLAHATQELLRTASRARRESICVWAGRATTEVAIVTHLIQPVFESTAYSLTVSQDERFLLAQYLRQERLLMFADLHTHPEEAFLSSVDRARPFGARDGFYAGVIPDFAVGEVWNGWRLYEVLQGQWTEVDIGERIRG